MKVKGIRTLRTPQIQMHSHMAQIRIEQTSGKQEIHQPQAEISIQQPRAELSNHTTPSKLTIDQTLAWEDMNLKSIMRLVEQFAEEGEKHAESGIARRAQQGDELMEIENDGNPVVQQAKQNSEAEQKQLGIIFIPSRFSIHTDYEPADVQVDVTTHRPEVDNKAMKPVHYYQPGTVHTSLEQYQDLRIDVVYPDR